ncbi:MAG: twin-arginine translocase subunit TatC [Actinomycetota bacterium]|jgi:sec-independent protein translocase protein TatC|nr:twin-arginine translocase subunit TatC [Actinomycetota bacterium]
MVALNRRHGGSKPPPSDENGMSLTEHLRELRRRLVISIATIFVGFVVGFIFYDDISRLLTEPYTTSVAKLEKEQGVQSEAVINGVATPFLLQAKVALVSGVVLASPVWLYQIWAFILPGLHRNERKWTYIFLAFAGPLFLAGIALGYYVLPKGLAVLIGFTPVDVTNLVDLNGLLSFVLRIMLVFGVSFEIPLFVVLLNLAGVVRARQLAKWRSWIVFGTFIFAAVATPSTDPITMLFLALPMTALFVISEVIARVIDRRRGRNQDPDYADYDDDEASPI